MKGNLKDMGIADLIQHTCQDKKTAQLIIEHDGENVEVYFDAGNVIHAVWDDLEGEEVIYRILPWSEGAFDLEVGVASPKKSITRTWTGLLLEGARLQDEGGVTEKENEKESNVMAPKKKGELLADALASVLEDSADITGAGVIGTDGLVYSINVPQRGMNENLVGASAAAIAGLGKRSVDQLKAGNFSQTLIQGDDGNIIVVPINDGTLFVALTAKDINLGMAFAEVRSAIKELNEIL